MATYLAADGKQRDVDGHLTLQAMQALVGGFVEHIALPDGGHLFIDEDGRRKGKPVNEAATNLYRYDHIVGDALLLTEAEFDDMRLSRFPEARR